MKIAVLSDTHGNVQLALNALKLNKNIDSLIHLGDHYRDAIEIGEKTGLRINAVAGNTDIGSDPSTDREKILDISGIRILITHGDIYMVKTGIDRLLMKAVEEEVNVVLYGHTHIAFKQKIGNILFINPGCILSSNSNNSYAVLELSDGSVDGEIVRLK